MKSSIISGYFAFTRKELIENTRNFRLLIMLVLFFFFGISSPVLAKLTPQIVEAFMTTITLDMPEPTALDSWTQFYKNVTQLGLSLTIILFSSCLSSEYSKGTLAIMLTKGLSRPSIILSKFSSATLIMTLSYWMSFVVTFGYTAWLWKGETLSHTLFSAFSLWLTAILYLCILMLGCTLFKQAFTAIIFLLIVITTITLLGNIDSISAYNPFILTSKNIDLISGSINISEFAMPIVLTVVLSIIFLLLSIVSFNKKQI